MKSELKTLLNTIDIYLLTGDENESRRLWNILAALRGPDTPDSNDLKDVTTSVIRATAFPLTAKQSNGNGGRLCASMVGDDSDRASRRKLLSSSHFILHAQSAFHALDLLWDMDNGAKMKRKLSNQKPKSNRRK